MSDVDLTFFVVATKSYSKYAIDLIESAGVCLSPHERVEFIVLTDNPSKFDSIKATSAIAVKVLMIPSFGWPEATLFRFRLMLEHWKEVSGQMISYIDADMRFVEKFSTADFFEPLRASKREIVLVRHPGYFNRNWIFQILMKSRYGPWEHRKTSAAFVGVKNRRSYVCGGIFWGYAKQFHHLLEELNSLVNIDIGNELIAKHNDESYLNNWKQSHDPVLVIPEWAYAPNYRNLKNIEPKISVIHKPENFVRLPTN